MTLPPYILKKLSTALQERQELPMWGKLPEFPLKDFVDLLRKTFDQPELDMTMITADWKSGAELKEGLSLAVYPLYFCMSPLSPSFAIYFSKEDLEKFLAFVTEQDEKRTLHHELFQKAFTQFIFLKALKTVDSLSVYEGLTVKMTETPIKEEESYCIDFEMVIHHERMVARLVLPKTFHQIITSHFSSRPLPLHKMDSLLELTLSLQAGKVSLSSKEIKTLEVGDFVILDTTHYHPKTQQGTLLLCYQETSLFYVKRKPHEVKLLDFAEYDYQTPQPQEGAMNDKEKMFFPEDDSLEDDLEIDAEDELFEENMEEQKETDMAIKEVISSAEDIPLTLCVEMGKVSMPLKEILALCPGAVLQLPQDPLQRVYLTLNTKPIAAGELIALGDAIGVKISEISK